MFSEELNIIRQAEDQADALKKDARVQARKLIEQANTEAGRIISEAEAKAKDCFAALVADGQTEITGLNYIDRGYEDLIEKFQTIGADIVRINGVDEE